MVKRSSGRIKYRFNYRDVIELFLLKEYYAPVTLKTICAFLSNLHMCRTVVVSFTRKTYLLSYLISLIVIFIPWSS